MAGGRGRWSGDAQITRGALYVLCVTGAISLIYLLSGEATQLELGRAISASGDGLFREYRLWTVVTSPLLEPDVVSLLFQGVMLWMFLPALERWWGLGRFLRFAVATSIAGVLGGALVGFLLGGDHAHVPLNGLDPFTFAGILAFGVLYARQPVRFFGALPMTGRQMAIGITAVMFLVIAIGRRWVEGAADAVAMLLALVMTSTRGSPKLWWLKWRQARVRRRLGVVDGGRATKPWVN
jgi:membrane associated rhomboid family serine protease